MLAKPPQAAWQPGNPVAQGAVLYLPFTHPNVVPRDASLNDAAVALTSTGYTWSTGEYGPQMGAFNATSSISSNVYKNVTSFPFGVAWLTKNTTSTTTSGEGPAFIGGTAQAVFLFQSGVANRVQWFVRDNASVTANVDITNAAVSDGNWHVWMAVSWAANNHSVYLDGRRIGNATTALGAFTFTLFRAARTWSGVVSHLAVWSGVVPDPQAVTNDWLSGQFSPIRDWETPLLPLFGVGASSSTPTPPPAANDPRPAHHVLDATVTTAPTVVVPQVTSLSGLSSPVTLIQNQGSGDVYIGGSGVSPSAGIVIGAGKRLKLPFCGLTYGVRATGTARVVSDQVY